MVVLYGVPSRASGFACVIVLRWLACCGALGRTLAAELVIWSYLGSSLL